MLVDRSGPEERALVGVTMLGLAVGIAASLTAGAADSETLPLVFPLTVQALAIGVTTTLMLPFFRFSTRTSIERPLGSSLALTGHHGRKRWFVRFAGLFVPCGYQP